MLFTPPTKAEMQTAMDTAERLQRANARIFLVCSYPEVSGAVIAAIDADLAESSTAENNVSDKLGKLRMSTAWQKLLLDQVPTDEDWEACENDYTSFTKSIDEWDGMLRTVLGRLGTTPEAC